MIERARRELALLALDARAGAGRWLRSWLYEYRASDPYRRVGRAYDPHRPRMRGRYDGAMPMASRYREGGWARCKT